ncbi:MAG: helix-turn-helix domain-containing protein [Marinibacterium sp.]|nr:helix-turn-helix domain-containing protein [Marinibacterium sp.]
MPRSEDLRVGRLIRHKRWVRQMSMQDLAAQVGVTCQQMQKYETGANHISVSRLCDIARALQVPPVFFFDGWDAPTTDADFLVQDEIALINAYRKAPSQARKAILNITEAAASA